MVLLRPDTVTTGVILGTLLTVLSVNGVNTPGSLVSSTSGITLVTMSGIVLGEVNGIVTGLLGVGLVIG